MAGEVLGPDDEGEPVTMPGEPRSLLGQDLP